MELHDALDTYLTHISSPHQIRRGGRSKKLIRQRGFDSAAIDDVRALLEPFLTFADAHGVHAGGLDMNTAEDWLDALDLPQEQRALTLDRARLFLEFLVEQGTIPAANLTPQLNHPPEYLSKWLPRNFVNAAQSICLASPNHKHHPLYLSVLLPVLLESHLHMDELLTIRAADASRRDGLLTLRAADGSCTTIRPGREYRYDYRALLGRYFFNLNHVLKPASPLLFLDDDGEPVSVEQVLAHLNVLAKNSSYGPITEHTFRDSYILRRAKFHVLQRSDFNPPLPTREVRAYNALVLPRRRKRQP